jgi:hypothetical protein
MYEDYVKPSRERRRNRPIGQDTKGTTAKATFPTTANEEGSPRDDRADAKAGDRQARLTAPEPCTGCALGMESETSHENRRTGQRTLPESACCAGLLERVRRRLARAFHPDLGGDGDVMKTINNELDRIRDAIRAEAKRS